jgi:hypothetical protein
VARHGLPDEAEAGLRFIHRQAPATLRGKRVIP